MFNTCTIINLNIANKKVITRVKGRFILKIYQSYSKQMNVAWNKVCKKKKHEKEISCPEADRLIDILSWKNKTPEYNKVTV